MVGGVGIRYNTQKVVTVGAAEELWEESIREEFMDCWGAARALPAQFTRQRASL